MNKLRFLFFLSFFLITPIFPIASYATSNTTGSGLFTGTQPIYISLKVWDAVGSYASFDFVRIYSANTNSGFFLNKRFRHWGNGKWGNW